ncbi:MAG: hypothetical protein Q8Q92_03235 [bacterium]|nr:hypothetical protein [bacterium]
MPVKGQRYFLRKDTELREGPGMQYKKSIPERWNLGRVPEDNWEVLVLNDEFRCVDGMLWINTSRGAVVPGNGTGWARVMPCTPAQVQAINTSAESASNAASMVGLNQGGEIQQKWDSMRWIGPVVRAERDANPSPQGTTGRVADFTGGFIHQSKHGTFETHGDIAQIYLIVKGSGGWLGFPTTNEFRNAAGHAQSNFEGGYITWDEKCQRYVPFDYQGYSRGGLDDCGGVIDPIEGFINFIDAVTGVKTNLETLNDASASRLEKDIAAGELVITFVPGGIVLKSAKYGKSVMVPAEKLALAASKELTIAQRSLINVLQKIRLEKAVEALRKPVIEYWDDIGNLIEHMKRHANEFWPGITAEEFTAIGLEVIEENYSRMIKYVHHGEKRSGFYDAARNIFVATDRESRTLIRSIFKPDEGIRYLKTLVLE